MSALKFTLSNVTSYININSFRNKLEPLSEFVCMQVDFRESKLDSSLPTVQFNLLSFRSPYRKNITARKGGLLL